MQNGSGCLLPATGFSKDAHCSMQGNQKWLADLPDPTCSLRLQNGTTLCGLLTHAREVLGEGEVLQSMLPMSLDKAPKCTERLRQSSRSMGANGRRIEAPAPCAQAPSAAEHAS